jgi:hypothetical protein
LEVFIRFYTKFFGVSRTTNPFGIGYTNHYNRVLSSQNAVMKLTAAKPEREIDFLEIS